MQVTRGGEPVQPAQTPRSPVTNSGTVRQVQDEGVAAFEYLCQRHVGPAWDLAYAVTGNQRDSAGAVADAFVRVLRPGRPARFDSPEDLEAALLSATRAAAIEAARRPRPDGAGDEVGSGGEVVAGATVVDQAPGAQLPVVTAAYRSLPERWRSVLWLTEVRHAGVAEAATVLGVSGNGLAQLSQRARSGLRERYLQAHLRGTVEADCRPVVEHLAAFTTNDLSPAALGPIEAHLRRCHACQEREADLDDLGAMLGRVAVPVPSTLVAMATTRWKDAANAATVVSRSRLGVLSFPTSGRKPLAGAALAVLGLGIIGAAVVSGPLLSHGPGSGGLAPAAAAPTEINRTGATGGLNPLLLSGDQVPPPPPATTAPTTSTTAAGAGAAGSGGSATAHAGGTGTASAPGGRLTTGGLLPSAPSAPSTSSIVPALPPPLPPVPAVTLPPATLPPLTVSTTVPKLLPKVTLP